jgi:hypothetical protein
VRHDLREKLGFAAGKNKDLRSSEKGRDAPEIPRIYLNFALSLLRTRRRRRQAQIEIAGLQRILVLAQR